MFHKILILSIIFASFIGATPLDSINTIRKKSGASSLVYSKILANAARKHALYVSKNQLLGHYEDNAYPYFYANAPWDRVVKSGFGTAVVVENISFYEPNFDASIVKLMGTVYHRLAFLFLQVDSIGYAKVGKIYVYDLSSQKIASLCRKHFKNAAMIIDRVCPNPKDIIPENLFNSAMRRVKKRAKAVVIYPYRNQKNVPLKGVVESPKFLYTPFGYPITITFNSSYYSNVVLKSFKLYRVSREVAGRIVTHENDIHKKIRKGTFIFAPSRNLAPHSRYRVKVVVAVHGTEKIIEWGFETR